MTLTSFAIAWVIVMILVRPRNTVLAGLSPKAQASAALAASLALIVVPLSFALVTLSASLSTPGGLRGCGRLLVAIVAAPLERLDLSISLLVVVAFPIALARGTVSAWRSQSAARTLALRGEDQGLVVVPIGKPCAFAAGLLRPRIVVSQGLLARTPPEFLSVVLEHEGAHRRGRHPLLLFVAETMARALPLPPSRWAADALRFALELRADDHAAKRTKDRGLVAEAVATLAVDSVVPAPAFEGDEVRRVRRLLAPPPSTRIRAAFVIASLSALFVFAAGHTAHCAAESANLLSATQCRLHFRD
jgi:hypothetical protein